MKRRLREPLVEIPISNGKVLGAFRQSFGFAGTLAFLNACERQGLRRARIPSARTLRLSILRRIPRRADLDAVAAQLGVTPTVVRSHWRRRHGRRR